MLARYKPEALPPHPACFIQGGAEKREKLKSLEKHEGNFKILFAPETVFYKSGNFINTQKKNPWSESASELYRPSDRSLSAM
jgi:hypothetical protein